MNAVQPIPVCLQSALATRIYWLVAGASLGLTQAILSISPLGISQESSGTLFSAQLAFMGALVGCALGLAQIELARVPLDRARPAARVLFELTGIATPSALLAFAAVLPHWVSRETAPPLVATGLVLSHLWALSVLVFQFRLPRGMTSLALPLLSWIVPAVLAPHDEILPVRIIQAVLNPTRPYALLAHHEPLAPLLIPYVTPILGLLVLRSAIRSFQSHT